MIPGEQVTAAITIGGSAPELPPGISVRVTNLDGQPVVGGLVQFVSSFGSTRTYRTNSDGIAFYPSAPVDTYGINFTHRDWASTSSTSRSLTRSSTNVNQVQHVTFTPTTSASTFRNLGWSPILESMGTTSSPAYQVSSVYGWRSFWDQKGRRWRFEEHPGIDIVSIISGSSEGKRLYSPFSGTVERIYEDPNQGNGYGIVIRYMTGATTYYVRYLHMQSQPIKANNDFWEAGNSVNAGDLVGHLGNTGNSTGPHLHMDVHRDYNPVTTHSFSNSIDPFYADGFIRQWWELNIQ